MHRPLVISAAVFVAFCNYGILQSYGSLFTDTLEKYGEGRSKTSLINSLLAGTSFGAGVIAGYLIKRTNLTVVSTIGSVLLPLGFVASYFATSVTFLLISISIISGLGISLSYVSAVVVLGTVISEKHKTSALSLQNVACGLPGIVVPYLFAWLTKTYTLSGTFLIYGGITLNNLAASILFSGVKIKDTSRKTFSKNGDAVFKDNMAFDNEDPVPAIETEEKSLENMNGKHEKASNLEDDNNITYVKKSQMATYFLFLIAAPLVVATVGGIQTTYQDIGTFKGLSPEQIITCISAFNIASTVGRFFPLIFQKFSKNPLLSAIVASLAGVSGQVILLLTSHFYTVLIGYALTGLTDGGVSGSISVVIYKILSPKARTIGFGLVLTVLGVLGTTSGPVYGAIYDQTESYALVLYITTTSFAVGSVLFVACFVSFGSVCTGRIIAS